MRIHQFSPARSSCGPNGQGMYSTFHEESAGVKYDLFFVNGIFYVCRDEYVGVFSVQGNGFVKGETGTKLHAQLNEKFPKVKPDLAAQNPPSS